MLNIEKFSQLETADLVKFTEEILHGKFYFLCGEIIGG